ncbi:MAG: hypothetical protein H7841_14755 [Magnetospirillum sp. WYHS-4]
MNDITNDVTMARTASNEDGTANLAWFPRKETPMINLEFSEDELQCFVERFDETPGWARWERVSGNNGRDLIIVHLDAPAGATVRLAKSESGAYMANGFGDWGLTVCSTLPELLDAINPALLPASRVA